MTQQELRPDTQKGAFLHGEGDAYFHRNLAALERYHAAALADAVADPVIRALDDLRPARILEVGAANGWRLDVARQRWGAHCVGIDPSALAVADGRARFPEITLQVGTADVLPHAQFDCVIFGFCLYLCDRSDLFRIAAEADRILADDGLIVVYDFFPPSPYRNSYAHRSGVYSYKMDYSVMWRWHPHYSLWRHEVLADHDGEDILRNHDNRLCVSVLRKLS